MGPLNVFGRAIERGVAVTVEGVPQDLGRIVAPRRMTTLPWFPRLRDASAEDDWQLVVRHRRGGPLGAFVADMQQRDLAVSFGALLLLVVSMGMLVAASSRAQRLARLQLDFVTAVSHELRTPLTVISSAADNIAQGVVHGQEQYMQYGSVIGNQVRQLSALVEQVLLFAVDQPRPAAADAQRPLEVSEIVDATLSSTEGLIRAAQFTVERDVARDLPPVTGDLLALSQLLQNLVTNALKYSGEQRWLRIRATSVDQGLTGNEVQISISDRGIGIGDTDLPRIFEPFYRSPSVAAAQIHGTGLGLTLAKANGRSHEGAAHRDQRTRDAAARSPCICPVPIRRPGAGLEFPADSAARLAFPQLQSSGAPRRRPRRTGNFYRILTSRCRSCRCSLLSASKVEP